MGFTINRKRIINYFFLSLLALLLLSPGRCASAGNGDNIYRDLIEREIVTYEDGCRAISCFAEVSAATMTFNEMVAELEEKGIVEKSWKYKAETPLTRGTMAFMISKLLKIKGGLTMRAIALTRRFTRFISKGFKKKNGPLLPDIGMSKRYAYRETQHMGLLPSGNNKTYITGTDMLAGLYRLEQYIKAEERKEKKVEKRKEKKERVVSKTPTGKP
ncbi:Coenzyme f420-dependent n5,n10-methylene tetrahydromethanopterin reductase and related flavin-dependent oxidoreductase [Candidatus Scalindua japonica]|uniref:Coenzyme f420-dependent n5,n10-methylene tetrahydromethanopterin reductase and related flavin-dependent oxidoreductase n=1 Tax=Candidatus Scalindua japonica TaxID=1284222 RepID=A0A286U3H1_9BACT|nr:hypothetical protein [Candidatus Scalindua japonica]GAX62662.1 Coenzyme f420-dependent n5,n10-methylene tetrahydromethanopterin reductase and related flavin-dependent oxidoreductase [Candidatus Scalindua japonica]